MSNITNITNINGMEKAAEYANAATGGLFFGLIIISVFLIMLFNLRENGIDRAVASASFACLLISAPLFYLQLLSILYPVFFSLALAGTLFYLRFKEKQG